MRRRQPAWSPSAAGRLRPPRKELRLQPRTADDVGETGRRDQGGASLRESLRRSMAAGTRRDCRTLTPAGGTRPAVLFVHCTGRRVRRSNWTQFVPTRSSRVPGERRRVAPDHTPWRAEYFPSADERSDYSCSIEQVKDLWRAGSCWPSRTSIPRAWPASATTGADAWRFAAADDRVHAARVAFVAGAPFNTDWFLARRADGARREMQQKFTNSDGCADPTRHRVEAETRRPQFANTMKASLARAPISRHRGRRAYKAVRFPTTPATVSNDAVTKDRPAPAERAVGSPACRRAEAWVAPVSRGSQPEPRWLSRAGRAPAARAGSQSGRALLVGRVGATTSPRSRLTAIRAAPPVGRVGLRPAARAAHNPEPLLSPRHSSAWRPTGRRPTR
jgi:hypothetical protein